MYRALSFRTAFLGLVFTFFFLGESIAQTTFNRLFGNAQDNYFNQIIPDGTEFYAIGGDDGKATVSRIGSGGQLLWNIRIAVGSGFTDALLAPGGDLVMVGFTLPFTSANSSIMACVTPSGTLSWFHTFDSPGQEGFTHLVQNGPNFRVIGFQHVGVDDDVVMLDMSPSGNVISKQIFNLPGNDGFYQDYETLPGSYLMAGLSGANRGVIYQMDASGNFMAAVEEPSNFIFRDVEALPVAPGHFLAGGTEAGGSQAPRLMHFDASFLPVWDVSLNGLQHLDQIKVAANGDIYVVGTANIGNQSRAVVLKLHEVNNAPVLDWAKYLQTGAVSHSLGSIAFTASGKIAFTDQREHSGTNGFGQFDAFIAVTDPDFESFCSKTTGVTLTPYANVFNSPDFIALSNYDPPLMSNGIDWLPLNWQFRAPCFDPTPDISCRNVRFRVEPEYDSRIAWYNDAVHVEGDDMLLACDPPPGSEFPVGNTTVTCTASNTQGDTAMCSFTLTVEKMPFDTLQPPEQFSPDGIFDRVRDRFGNPYRLSELQIPETMSGSLLCQQSGYFNLYFEPGCGMDGNTQVEMDRRTVLCQLFEDISAFIPRPSTADKVNIWVRDINNVSGTTSNTLGLATSFYVVPATGSNGPFKGGIADGEVWKTIISGIDSYTGVSMPLNIIGQNGIGFYHGMVAFNFNNFNWRVAPLSQQPALNEIDLYSVGLHEATHALGFASLLTPLGVSVFDLTNSSVSPYSIHFARYDTFLWSGTAIPGNGGISNQQLIVNPGACSSMYDYKFNPALPLTVLQPTFLGAGACIQDKTFCPYGIRFFSPGVIDQITYTPNCWEQGSSLSHLEDECHLPNPQVNNQYYVMSNANGAGQTYMKRFLKEEERTVLCELGYPVAATYGNSADLTDHTYLGGACPGIGVAGINDGISNNGTYAFTTMINMPFNTTGQSILQNDLAVSFECFEPVYGGGGVSPASGGPTTALSFTGFTTPGVKLFRYVPVGSNGKKGNITYVFIYVKGAACPGVGPCQMVGNNDFESVTSCGAQMPYGTASINCWLPAFGSPDAFTSSCTLPGCQLGVSTFNSIPPTGSHNGSPNNSIIGLYANNGGAPAYSGTEAIQTLLNTPLTPGQTYQLSFWAKVNNNINGPASNQPAHVRFHATNSTLPSGQVSAYAGAGLAPLLPDFIVPINTSGPNAWYSFVQTFTFNGNTPMNNLIIAYPYNFLTIYTQGYVFIDDVSLTPVTSVPTFTPPSPVCLNDPAYDLSTTVSIPGGVFSGPGINGAFFNPAAAPIGSNVLSYTVTDANGCKTTATATIVVAQPPVVTFLSPANQFCQDASPVNLTPYVFPAGGVFSGPGVSGTQFIPANAGLGAHTLTYTYAGGACPVSVSATFTVKACIDTCEVSNICLDFDGVNDYVDAANPLNNTTLANNFTVACWFRDDRGPGNGNFFRIFGWIGAERFELGEKNDNLTFYTTSLGATEIVSNTLVRDGKWHHVAAAKNGSNLTVYLDGLAVGGLTNLNIGAFSNLGTFFRIGNRAGAQLYWRGRIDEFKVWDAVMTQQQVVDEMRCSLDPNNSLLLVHYPFDQYIPWGNNAGNTQVLNVANLAQNGTLHNFALTAGNSSNWVGRDRDRLPYCNPDHFAWIEGDNYGNYGGRSKVYDGDIFSAEIQVRLSPTGQPFNSPVFTRRDVKGNIVFRTLLGFEGMITDFIRTDEGCFLLTGYFPKFQLNFDNRSFIARVQPNGTIDWVNAYNFGERETLNRIIRSDNPSPAAFPYIISGIVRPQPPTNNLSTYDDIILLAIDNQGSIGWMRNIGDFGNGVTDDEYHADLMNYQGGYALAGSYRNTLISQAVIFRTNNTGTTQLPSSAQYPLNTFIYDIEPSADGTGIIVAGQVVYGTALLAKVDPNGQTIWSLTFPALRAFRRVVVMPNGDIYVVGQRNPTAPFRNVIVKLKDFGTGYSLVWQKYADQPGENNWGAADLAWYSGKMFFYTDTRYNNPNGWPNGDIAAVLYNLDQSPDNCPFTKGPLPAVQSYVLVGAQMGSVAINPVTPPLAQQFPAGVPFQLQRDSLCPGYSCSCNFVSLSISKTWPIPVWSVPLSCNQAPVALPGCPSQYNPLRFNGRLQCKGGCAFNGLSYTLKDPAGVTILTGNISMPSFSIQLPLSVLQTQGVYTMTIDGKCGNMNCQSCVIQFTVPACPPPCSCAEPGFTNDVSAGFNWVQYPNCQFKFTPKKLTACDQVEWKIAISGSNNFTTVGATTGNQTLTYTFPTTQQYVVCMTVTRTPAGGAPCVRSRCWTIDVDCSLEPQIVAGSADFGGFDACSGTVIDNGGFMEGALEGGLAENGSVSRWDAAAGNPEVALEAGNNDPNLVRLRGRLQTADLLYQDSLPLTIWDSLRFSMALRPVHGLIMPGTELVVMISENKPEGIGCADSTCLEIMRLPVPDDLDSSFWLKANSLFILKNITPRYLGVWVENPFADDEALNSVVDIDNVCLSRFDIVSEKTPPENDGSMRIYPNPNAGIFTVDLLGGGMEGGTLRVIDLAGKLLMSQPVETGHAHQHIHAQNLPGGFYLLQWTNEGKVMAVGRFVKQ